jgi:hypothetical protein
MYKDWIIEKSIIYKTVDNNDDDLPSIKNKKTNMTNEVPYYQDKERAGTIKG